MHELVHTSLPKGLFGGSGYAVAAATRDMPESLRLALQGISNLENSTPGVTWSSQVVNAGGGSWLVLSRIQPAKADHTGRSNYLAHHVALGFHQDSRVDPASILKNHPWMTTWSGEPRWLEPRTAPAPLATGTRAEGWKRHGLDPGWAGYLADNHTQPVPILYPPGLGDPLPLVLDALCMLPVADRWQVAFNTRSSSFTRSAGWWWSRTDSAQAPLFRRQSGLVDLTGDSQAPGNDPLVWKARGQQPPERVSMAGARPSSGAMPKPGPASKGSRDRVPALPQAKGKSWPLLAGAGLLGLVLGILPAGTLAWQAGQRAEALSREKVATEAKLAGVLADQQKDVDKDKQCQDKLDKMRADNALEVKKAHDEAEQAFERARILNVLLEWNTTPEELSKNLKLQANLPDAGAAKVLDSKLVKRLGVMPAVPKEIVKVQDAQDIRKGQAVTLAEGLQASLSQAADVAKKAALIDQALNDPKAGPKLVLLDPKDTGALRKALAKSQKPLSEALETLEKGTSNEPVQITVTPGEWRIWVNNERRTAQGERFPGELGWTALISRNLQDNVLVTVGQVRRLFASIRGTTGPMGRKMEPKVTTPFNLLKAVVTPIKDEEGRQQALAQALSDKATRDRLLTALNQLDSRWDISLDEFTNAVPPQPVWLLHDEIRLTREHLQILDKAIPKIQNIAPEDREKLVQFTRRIYKRLSELGEHHLEAWTREPKDNKKDPKNP